MQFKFLFKGSKNIWMIIDIIIDNGIYFGQDNGDMKFHIVSCLLMTHVPVIHESANLLSYIV